MKEIFEEYGIAVIYVFVVVQLCACFGKILQLWML